MNRVNQARTRVTSILGLVLCAALSRTSWARPTPPLPSQLVLDEPKLLKVPALTTLEYLLIEHERLADQKILIGIFGPLDGEKPEKWADQVFSDWKLDQGRKGATVLLTLFSTDMDHKINVGFGLDSIITVEKKKEISSKCLGSSALRKDPTKALFCATYLILEALESPLIVSGKAAELYQNSGSQDALDTALDSESHWGWIVFLVFACSIVLGTLRYILVRKRDGENFTSRISFSLFRKYDFTSRIISKLNRKGSTDERND